MVNNVGQIKSIKNFPHIYFIVKDEYIYVGETQKTPILRWSSHLNKGSFEINLTKKDYEILNNNLPTLFFAFSCEEIKTFSSTYSSKSLTQYVEHLVHLTIISNKNFKKFKLISNTKKTCPLIFDFSVGEKIAIEIVKKFEEVYFEDILN